MVDLEFSINIIECILIVIYNFSPLTPQFYPRPCRSTRDTQSVYSILPPSISIGATRRPVMFGASRLVHPTVVERPVQRHRIARARSEEPVCDVSCSGTGRGQGVALWYRARPACQVRALGWPLSPIPGMMVGTDAPWSSVDRSTKPTWIATSGCASEMNLMA